jgi:hypothetical protein
MTFRIASIVACKAVAMNLGRIGIWRLRHAGANGVEEIEALGYSTLWIGGSPSTDDARPATRR